MRAKGSKLWASALAEAAPTPFWTDRPERPDPRPPLTTATTTQLAVIGGGDSGLWIALLAKERDPSMDVVLLESGVCGHAASGRNGGFCYATGYTGLGVGATRFGAQVVLDRLSNLATERTRLRFVRSRPWPLPPEPLRSLGINLTRWSLARADLRQGRRNLWLRALDGAGLGFDS